MNRNGVLSIVAPLENLKVFADHLRGHDSGSGSMTLFAKTKSYLLFLLIIWGDSRSPIDHGKGKMSSLGR